MRAMGLISYTFYLVHVPVLLLLKKYVPWGMWPRAGLGFVLTVTISAAMYFFVERHMAALRRRLHGRKQRGLEEPTATASGRERERLRTV